MAKIFIGIAKHNTCKEFINSMLSFLPSIKQEHDIEVYEIHANNVCEAQNAIAEQFLQSDKDYLLTLEDDHWHHTKDMLNALLKPNTYVCAINYYSRHEGKLSTLMNYSGNENFRKAYIQAPYKDGYHEVDLCGFGMTLIKREVFDILDVPYFRPNDYYEKLGKEVANKATDQDFCKRLAEHGIKPVGCFDYVLTHRGISKDNFLQYRQKDILKSMKNSEDKLLQRAIFMLQQRKRDRLQTIKQ